MKKKYPIIIAIIIFLIIAFFGNKIWNEKNKRNFDAFYSADINGRIINIGYSSGITYFMLDNSNARYGFAPEVFDYDHYMSFEDSAKVGDIIIKPAMSDTVRLIKGTHTYLFTFRKY
ncbi:hypothetical protein ACTJJB_32320 [Chitinophaga sp. 22536]|uniref:hypothetical protein n=1 Tax=unclassified Chitinophaga TaxID=2619133 RepID=UPI003F87BB1C